MGYKWWTHILANKAPSAARMSSSAVKTALVRAIRLARSSGFDCGASVTKLSQKGGGTGTSINCFRVRLLESLAVVPRWGGANPGSRIRGSIKGTARELCSASEGKEGVLETNGQMSSTHVVTPPVAVVNQDDIEDLNAEIGGFVGTLGDPDFDLQEDSPRTESYPAATNLAPTVTLTTASPWDVSTRRPVVTPGTGTHSSGDEPGNPDLVDSSRDLSRTGRLTLADDPSVERFDEHFVVPKAGVGDSDHRIAMYASERDCVANSKRSKDNFHEGYHESDHELEFGYEKTKNGQSGSVKQGTFEQGMQCTGSVLVLNGAACFARDRLVSTGEPMVSQESIYRSSKSLGRRRKGHITAMRHYSPFADQ